MSERDPDMPTNTKPIDLPSKSLSRNAFTYIAWFFFAGSVILFAGGLIFIAIVMTTTDASQAGAVSAAGDRMAKGLIAIGVSIWFTLIGLIVYFVTKHLHRKNEFERKNR